MRETRNEKRKPDFPNVQIWIFGTRFSQLVTIDLSRRKRRSYDEDGGYLINRIVSG